MPFTPAPLDATNIVAGFSPGLPPPIDAVELLPPSRRPLLVALRQRGEDAMNLARPLHDQLDDLRPDRHRLNASIAELKKPRGLGGPGLDDEHASVVDARQKLSRVEAEMVRLNELLEVRRARAQSAAALVMNVESWLRNGRPSGTVLVEATEIETKSIIRRGETAGSALERLRHRLRELDADRHRVESAPLPSALAKVKMRGEIAQLAERGAPDVGALVEVGHAISWPMTVQRLGLAAVVGKSGDRIVGDAMDEVTDTMALVAWLHRDALVARLEAEIDAIADDSAALSPEDRERKLAEIAQDRLVTERHEAALVRGMQGDGLPVEHRADADPRAVLGVEAVVAQPAADPGGLHGMAARAIQAIEVLGR